MKPVFSVIIPAYNEEAVIDRTFERLDGVMKELGEPYELVFVNDCSRDRTAEMLRALSEQHSYVRVLHFARNFGHQIAVTAGLDAACGDAIIIIDADLQDPPEVILEMVQKWREGYEVVYGKRLKRDGESAFKKATAWLYYRVLNHLVTVRIPEDTGDFRLVDRRAADVVRQMPEHNRFLRGMFAWVGFRQTEVLFHRDKRFAGESKYPLKRMLRLATDGILAFSHKPLNWITWLGLLAALGGGLWLLVLLILKIAGAAGYGMASIAALLLLMGGAIMGCLGILGAYIGRIHDEVRGRPLYVIANRDGYGSDEKSAE